MDKAAWYRRRLRTMQAGEVIWRSRRASQALIPNRQVGPADELLPDRDWEQVFASFRTAGDRPVLLDRTRARDIAATHPEHVEGLLRSADAAVALSFQFFGYPTVTLTQPVDWSHDPIAGFRWPDVPSSRINHRTAGADVKWIWELNRLQQLPVLAEAWLFTGDPRYSAAALDQLDSWVAQNPPGLGIAWRGSFEIGLRAVSIALAIQGLRDAPQLSLDRFRRFAGVLAESAHLCWQDRSLFSSANNHLIGEMAGLATVAMLLPELRRAADWERLAVDTLSAEASKQILADGCGAEQSVAYQMFTAELINLVSTLLAQRDGQPPAPLSDAVARSSAFLSRLVGRSDPDPRYGDDDEGFALRLGDEQRRTVRTHLGIVSATGEDSLDAAWFRATGAPTAPVPEHDSSFVAADGGLVVLRSGQRRITMDIGPLGYLAIAAHGHADALSVTLSCSGAEVVSDPGAGSYYGHPHWRTVLRGTAAHPTVCVDDHDQSVIGGPFLWSRHARVTARRIDLEAGVVEGEHDGYSRLPGAVIHRRWLVAPPVERSVLVVDLITGGGQHCCVQNWPLHPGLTVDPIAGGHRLSRHGEAVHQILYAATAALNIGEVRGDEDNDLGWWSDRLESRRPAWWVSSRCQAPLPIVMATLLSPLDGVQTHGLSVGITGESHWEAAWFEGHRRVECCG